MFLILAFQMPWHSVNAQSKSEFKISDSLKIAGLQENFDKYFEAKQFEKAIIVNDSILAIARNYNKYKIMGDSYFNYGRVEKNKSNPAGLMDFLKTAISYYRRANAWKQAGKSYFIIAQSYLELKDENSALDYFKESLLLRERVGDSLGIVNTQINIGALTYKLGNYYDASTHFFTALQIAGLIKNDKLRAFSLSNLSNISNKLNNYDKSIEYLNEALAIHRASGNKLGESGVLLNLGNTYVEKGDNAKAKGFFLQSLEIKTDLKTDEKGLAGIYLNLGVISKKEGDTAKARSYYEKSLLIGRKIGDKDIESNALNNLGSLEMEQNNDSAEKFLLESLKKAKETGNYILIKTNYKNLQEYYSIKGNSEMALKYASMFQTLNDSSFKEDNASKILELQAKYETAEKEKQLANLTREKLEQKLKLQEANQTRNTLIGLSVFLLVLSVLLYSRFLIKKRSQKQLSIVNAKLNELNNTKDKIFSIISHDLKNSVSAFTNITQAMNANFDSISTSQIKYYVGEMSNSANGMKGLFRNLLDWAKSQRNLIAITPVNIDIHELIHENISQLQTQLNRKQLDVLIEVQDNLQVFSDNDILTTVIRNLLTNAIKYSRNGGIVEINAAKHKEIIELSVTDFGLGMEPEELEAIMNQGAYVNSKPDAEGEKGAGLGLMLCKELLLKISGKFIVTSQKDIGSRFAIVLPVKI